jgi:hypothetical protein
MDPKLLIPALSAGDVILQMLGIMVYIAIGVAGLAQAPRDERTRVFCALALLNGAGTLVPIVFWWLAIRDPFAAGRLPLAFMLASLSVATIALFHLSQVFPRRRPWIRGSGPQLPIVYALTPIAVPLLIRLWPVKGAPASAAFMAVVIAFGFPLVVLLGLVLPIATIVGLVRSFREAPPAGGRPDVRPPIAGFLMSMLAGTAVAVLALGPLEAAAPESPATLLVRVTVWMLGLLMPAAYAAGIWYYRVLEIPLEGSVVVEPE